MSVKSGSPPRANGSEPSGRRAAAAPALTPPAAVRYLLERGLVQPRSIVDGELVAVDAARRNRNVKVVCGDGASFLLKQGIGTGGTATVAHEAAVYDRMLGTVHGDVARNFLPRTFGYDGERGVLVLELVSGARDLREYHGARRGFPKTVASALGRVLADLHRLKPEDVPGDVASAVHRRAPPPWVLTLHRPRLEHLAEMSAANLSLVRIIQAAPPLCAALDRLWRDWRPDSLIHGDVKWENCLVVTRDGSKRTAGVKLVDWEFAGTGDPCWDVGSIFSNYLAFWLWSIPVTGEDPPDHYLELAAFPLERMQPAMRSFWQSYARRMRLDRASAAAWLSRAIRFAAARLVQTAYEHMQQSPRVTGNIVCLLQLSCNIMDRPREATRQLLGIPLGTDGAG